ncbi:receptor-type tyrosine-protein phosphatase alpha-like [Dysidea avara]|uniref:receptor-type tyrosine-protein phosphatase alpha-like n=1 Tax=Dysidea avara TaxID=196820 RepID=UPI003332F6D8
MIWELDIQTIVMLTNLEEKGRVKCHQYWPDDKVTIPGSVKVSIQEQLELADYAVRTFSLKRSGSKEERIVKQFHYTTWPDFGVPEHPTPVLRFTRRILSSDQQEAGPIVVHCSAGVGRSGTFITLHSQLQRIASEATIDIFPFVRQMRYRRCHMVQTEPQYVFIHDALLEAVECGDTEVVARDLKIQYRKLSSASEGNPTKRLIEDEFKKIDDSIHLKTDHVAGQAPANKAKNRYANILPFDGSRCRISAIPGQEGSDYINASYVDGYLKQKAYVATQGPLPDTAAEFWRMVWELKSATIVMLVKEREQGRVKCHHYWPDTGAETFNQYQVVAHATNDYQEYTLREFKLVDKKDNSSLPVRHFQFSTWPEGGNVPENSAGLIDLIGQIQKWQQHSGNKPIIVHCSGGSGRTGTYIAISMLLDRLKVEGVVDVFQTVRALRLQRMHMVQSLVQYEFCYKTVLEFLDSFELYSNFK